MTAADMPVRAAGLRMPGNRASTRCPSAGRCHHHRLLPGGYRPPTTDHCLRQVLSECDPEPVRVTHDELPCSVEGVLKDETDFDIVLQIPVLPLDIGSVNVQVHLAAIVGARPAAAGDHQLTVPVAKQGE